MDHTTLQPLLGKQRHSTRISWLGARVARPSLADPRRRRAALPRRPHFRNYSRIRYSAQCVDIHVELADADAALRCGAASGKLRLHGLLPPLQ